LPGELRLRGKRDFAGHSCLAAPLRVGCSFLWQIQLSVEEDRPQLGGLTQKNADLAVVDFAGCTGVLALYADRLGPLFDETGLVDNENSIGAPEVLDGVLTTAYLRRSSRTASASHREPFRRRCVP
jgi:hypothetical protein